MPIPGLALSLLLAQAPPALDAPALAEQPPLLIAFAGVQKVPDGTGFELSVLRYHKVRSTPEQPSHSGYGWGFVVDSTPRFGALELEGVVGLAPRSRPGYDWWAFTTYFTASAGPCVRLPDHAGGVQATASVSVLVMPIIFYLRPRHIFADHRTDLTAGFMLKIPVWFASD